VKLKRKRSKCCGALICKPKKGKPFCYECCKDV
jgi:hypothetical protein